MIAYLLTLIRISITAAAGGGICLIFYSFIFNKKKIILAITTFKSPTPPFPFASRLFISPGSNISLMMVRDICVVWVVRRPWASVSLIRAHMLNDNASTFHIMAQYAKISTLMGDARARRAQTCLKWATIDRSVYSLHNIYHL